MTDNAASWFVDRHPGEGRGDKPAFREAAGARRTLTYGGLAEATGRFAGALQRAGVNPEDRAAMFVLDQIEFPTAFWGAIKAGVVPVPLNTLLSTDVYRAILTDADARIAFVSSELAEVVLPAALGLVDTIVIIRGDAPEGTVSWDDFLNDSQVAQPVDVSPDDVAFWLYSSGSTGAPKGVRHVHSALRFTCDTYAAQVLGIRENDTVFSAAKLFFAYGLGNGMSFPMSVGATTVLFNARPTPDVVSGILEVEKPTIYCGVPTLYAALLQKWSADGAHPDAPLRSCISAGEALPEDIGKRWRTLWGIDILDGVGSTEMLHIFLSNRADDVTYGTSGTAVPGYDVRLVDEHNIDIQEPGEVGELLVRGGSAATDYWNKPDKSRATFEGDWTRTGDKYELNDAERFVYCGRTDDMFKVSGIWVSPFEIEQALAAFPAILEAAVVAHRDEDGLQKPKAFVVLNPGETEAALADLSHFVKERIGMWKYPRWVEVADDLPKTATGKIQRFKLRVSE